MSNHNRQNIISGPQAQGPDGRAILPPPEMAGVYPAAGISLPAYDDPDTLDALRSLDRLGARFVPLGPIGFQQNAKGEWRLNKAPVQGCKRLPGYRLQTALRRIAGVYPAGLGITPTSIGMAVADVDAGDPGALIRAADPYLVTATARIGGTDLWWHCPEHVKPGDGRWAAYGCSGEIRSKCYVVLWTGLAEELAAYAVYAQNFAHYPAALFPKRSAPPRPANATGSWAAENHWDNPDDARKGGLASGESRRKTRDVLQAQAARLQGIGYSTSDIALNLGITPRTARIYLRRANQPDARPDYQRHTALAG